VPTFRTVTAFDSGTTINITAADVGNAVIINISLPNGNIQLPTPNAGMAGKKIILIEIAGQVPNLTALNGATYKTNTLSNLQRAGTELITDGTYWYALGGN
jgi:hypothetical protein